MLKNTHIKSQFKSSNPYVFMVIYGYMLYTSPFSWLNSRQMPGQCLAPSYDEAGEDLADAMARLHVPEVKFNFIPKAAGSVDETMLGSNVYIPQGFKPSPRGLTMKPWFI